MAPCRAFHPEAQAEMATEAEIASETQTASSSFEPGFTLGKARKNLVKNTNQGRNSKNMSQDDSYGSNVEPQRIPRKKNKQITLHQDSVVDSDENDA